LVHFVLFLVTLIYAITFTIAKDIMPTYVNSSLLVWFRVAGALLLFWFIHPFEKRFFPSEKKQKIKWQDLKPLFIASIFGVAFNMLLFFGGLARTTPINGAVLMLFTPLFVVILARIIGKEVLGAKKITGILLAACGAALLMTGKGLQFSKDTFWGDLMVTVNAIFYAVYLVVVRKLLNTYTVMTVSKWTFLFGLLLITPFALPHFASFSFQTLPLKIVLEIVYVIVFTTFLAYLLNAWAIEKAGAVVVGSYIYLQPLLAGIIAIGMGSDKFTWLKLVSAILVFVGVFLSSDKQQALLKAQIAKRKSRNKTAQP
jgi:drug/metabolite transporter (DMT)-like permease